METVKVYESVQALGKDEACYVVTEVVNLEAAIGDGLLITSSDGLKLVLPKGTIFTYTGFDN